MSLPSEVLEEHHRRCDDLFAAAEDAVRDGDWASAKAAFARFNDQMQAHFSAEEQSLFPAFAAAAGGPGPTHVMRYEHEQMRGLLGQMTVACESSDRDTYEGVAETLLTLMQQHNMKEENILYPMCDRALGAEAEAFGAKLAADLE